MARAVQRTAARRDFIIHYAYLLEHAGLDIAKRFREAVERTYAELAEMPGMVTHTPPPSRSSLYYEYPASTRMLRCPRRVVSHG